MRAYTLLPNSRRTIYVDEEPGLDATDLSARIDADRPIFAERAMYMSSGGQSFTGGTASAGITAPALQWFIAEGATGAFFDLFILIGNPSATAAEVTVTYLLPDGTTVERPHQVAAESRLTITVKGEDRGWPPPQSRRPSRRPTARRLSSSGRCGGRARCGTRAR